MIETLKTLRQSIEDLTKAYRKLNGTDINNFDYEKEMEERLKGLKNVVDFSDFVTGNPDILKQDITSSTIKTIQGQSSPTIPFVLIASNLNLFEDGKRYAIMADFNILSAVAPPYVQICLKNDSNNTYIYKSKEIPTTERIASIEFTYRQKAGETIKLLFEAGGNIVCSVEWKNIKIYKIETQYTDQQKNIALRLLDEHVEATKAYINAIRNKNGNITIPEAREKYDAVNLQLLHDRVNNAINKLQDEVNNKLLNIKSRIAQENDNGQLKIGVDIRSQGQYTGESWTTLPIYYDINARVDELKNKSGVTTDTVKSTATEIVKEYFITLFKNGYMQTPDMSTPDKAFPFVTGINSINNLYWEEIGSFEEYYRKKGESSSRAKFTIWQLKIREYDFPTPGPNPGNPLEPKPLPGDSVNPRPPKSKF